LLAGGSLGVGASGVVGIGRAADGGGDGDIDLVTDHEFRRAQAEGAAVELRARDQGGLLTLP